MNLFDAEPFAKPGNIPSGPTATPAPIGSGPANETCGTCLWRERVRHHDANYLKCGKAKTLWTHGAASDIRAKWPACSEWEQQP